MLPPELLSMIITHVDCFKTLYHLRFVNKFFYEESIRPDFYVTITKGRVHREQRVIFVFSDKRFVVAETKTGFVPVKKIPLMIDYDKAFALHHYTTSHYLIIKKGQLMIYRRNKSYDKLFPI